MPAVAEEHFEGIAVVEGGGGFGVHVGCLVVSGCVDADVGDGFAGFVGDEVEMIVFVVEGDVSSVCCS